LRASVLLTDLYELTMLQAYFEQGMNGLAVFELFVRKLPARRNFLLAAGLAQVLDYLADLRFTVDDLTWLRSCGRFTPAFVGSLATEHRLGTPLLAPVLRAGRLAAPAAALAPARSLASAELARLPERLRSLDDAEPYRVEIAPPLRSLAAEIDART